MLNFIATLHRTSHLPVNTTLAAFIVDKGPLEQLAN